MPSQDRSAPQGPTIPPSRPLGWTFPTPTPGSRPFAGAPVAPAPPVTVFAASGKSSGWRRRPATKEVPWSDCSQPSRMKTSSSSRERVLHFADRRFMSSAGSIRNARAFDSTVDKRAFVFLRPILLIVVSEPQVRPPREFDLAPAATIRPAHAVQFPDHQYIATPQGFR